MYFKMFLGSNIVIKILKKYIYLSIYLRGSVFFRTKNSHYACSRNDFQEKYL